MQRPANVGILAIEAYFPRNYVPQTALEQADGCEGKYTVGLGQESLAYCDDREDVGSILLTALARLMEGYGVAPADIGRLEVGTETLVDKSKSIKTLLLEELFAGHADVEGVTSTNACYGGTAALFNSVAWVESSAWDGRYAVVVCGDIAVYAPGPARPTSGAGAVAMLIGPDAPLALAGPRATHACEVYDFYKPHGDSEYAVVDGKLSQSAYLTAVDETWAKLKAKLDAQAGRQPRAAGAPAAPRATIDSFDYACLHSPYNKLVQKGFARLVNGDMLDEPSRAEWAETAGGAEQLGSWPTTAAKDSVGRRALCAWRIWRGVVTCGRRALSQVSDRGAEKLLATLSKARFARLCSPTHAVSKAVGNCYTAAVYRRRALGTCWARRGRPGGSARFGSWRRAPMRRYMNLLSLVANLGAALEGKRTLVFSYRRRAAPVSSGSARIGLGTCQVRLRRGGLGLRRGRSRARRAQRARRRRGRRVLHAGPHPADGARARAPRGARAVRRLRLRIRDGPARVALRHGRVRAVGVGG